MPKFQKGQSGNPAGKPKGVLYVTPALRSMLAQPHPDYPGKTHRDVIVATLVEKAEKGDLTATAIVLDRVDGKVAQPVEHAGEGGGDLLVRIIHVNETIGPAR